MSSLIKYLLLERLINKNLVSDSDLQQVLSSEALSSEDKKIILFNLDLLGTNELLKLFIKQHKEKNMKVKDRE